MHIPVGRSRVGMAPLRCSFRCSTYCYLAEEKSSSGQLRTDCGISCPLYLQSWCCLKIFFWEIEEQAHSCLHIWKLVCCQEQHIRVESKNIFWLRNLEDNLKFHCITVWVILFWAEHWAKLSLNWVVCVIKTSAAWYQPRHQQLPHRNESDLLVVSMTHYPLFR